jgi:ankyrin repeat protein
MFFLVTLIFSFLTSTFSQACLSGCLLENYFAHRELQASVVPSVLVDLPHAISQDAKAVQIADLKFSFSDKQDSVDEELCKASAKGDRETVAAILRSGHVRVNTLNDQRLTPLQLAMHRYSSLSRPAQIMYCDGYVGTIELLIDHNAHLMVEDAAGVTPLMLACTIGDADLLRKIAIALTDQCDPQALLVHINAVSREGKSALHYAVDAGNYDCVKKMACFRVSSHEQSPAVKDMTGRLFGAEEVKVEPETAPAVLLGSRCRRTGHDEITKALICGNTNILYSLLGMPYRSDVNHFALDVHAKSILHYALDHRCSQAIDLLLPFKGAQDCKHLLSAQDGQGYTLLHHAVMKKSPDCVKSLIKLGADVRIPDSEQLSALHHAVRLDNDELVEPFLATPGAFKVLDRDGNTPFMSAVAGNQRELIAQFKKVKNLELMLSNKAGDSALHIAVRIKSPGMIRCLIYHYAILAGPIRYEQKQDFLKGLLKCRNKKQQSVKELAALPGYELCNSVFKESGLID